MRLLDERGRIFGKLNPVDLLVVALIAAVAFFAAPKLVGGGGGDGEMALTYTVLVEKVEPEAYAAALEHIPSRLMASGVLVGGYVTGAEAAPHIIYTKDERGRIIMTEDERLLDVSFTVEASIPKQEVLLNTVGTQEIRIGRGHYLKTEYFEFVGPVETAVWAEK